MKQIELTKWALPTAAAIAVLATAVLQPRFLSFENIGNVLSQSIPLEIFAIAQMLPLLIRGLDLSQGGTVVLTSVSFALMAQRMGTGVAAVLALLIGCAAGLTNGLVISRLRVSSLVVTLGTGSVLSGVALIASNGQPISDV